MHDAELRAIAGRLRGDRRDIFLELSAHLQRRVPIERLAEYHADVIVCIFYIRGVLLRYHYPYGIFTVRGIEGRLLGYELWRFL